MIAHNAPENRSTVDEQRLADYGITPALTAVPLADIDATASVRLQNRAGVRLDDDNTLQMALALESDPDRLLPRIVVARVRGRLVVVDGNHRVAAYRMAGRPTIDAYVIDGAEPVTVESLALEANATNGRSLTADERLTLALRYAELTNDLPMAARRFGYRHDTLATKRRAVQGQDKATRAAGVKITLPEAKAESLNRLDEDQLRTIGRELLEQADTRLIRESVANILAVPASDQANQVQQEVGRLAQAVKAKRTPVGKARAKAAGPTLKAAAAQLHKIAAQMRANPSWRVDPALIAAVDLIVQEVDRGARKHAAA